MGVSAGYLLAAPKNVLWIDSNNGEWGYEQIFDYDGNARLGYSNVVFSPDGRWLVTRNATGRFDIWDAQTWELVVSKDSDYGSRQFLISPNGNFLGLVNDDGLTILGLPELDEIFQQVAHVANGEIAKGDLVKALVFSPNSTLIVSASNTELILWRLDP